MKLLAISSKQDDGEGNGSSSKRKSVIMIYLNKTNSQIDIRRSSYLQILTLIRVLHGSQTY